MSATKTSAVKASAVKTNAVNLSVGESARVDPAGWGAGQADDELPRPRGREQIMVTPVGLQIPGLISYHEWKQAGRRLARIVDSSSWCLGDWIVFGESRYTDRYRQVMEEVGLDYKTLRNYVWVARKFPLGRRREGLSLQHHAEVAALPAAAQDDWLSTAAEQGWSRNELRRRVRSALDGSGADGKAVTIPRISVTQERIERWHAAARTNGTDLNTWIVSTLDAASPDSVRDLGE
jgi:hypothetical protein